MEHIKGYQYWLSSQIWLIVMHTIKTQLLLDTLKHSSRWTYPAIPGYERVRIASDVNGCTLVFSTVNVGCGVVEGTFGTTYSAVSYHLCAPSELLV